MKIIIIGNGISGITAARWIRKLSDHDICVISSETKFFYSRTALMYIYMGHLRQADTEPYEGWFWAKNKIDLLQDHVHTIDFNQKQLHLKSGSKMSYDKLILALGSKSNMFGWPGQDLNGVGGLYHFQDLEKMEQHSEGLSRAVVVGGGLIGIEMAEMFRSRNIPVTMLVRENNYWDNVLPQEEAAMISRHIIDHHIDLRLASNLERIEDDGNGNAGAVIIKETGERIQCGYVGLTAGVSPNIDFVRESPLDTEKGVLVDGKLQTNIMDVFAIGDCAQLRHPPEGRRSVEAVWYTGRMMGETVAHTICGNPCIYEPGVWFNSAKFLDIEYQVYGNVPNQLQEHQATFYWEHSGGRQSLRLVYDAESKAILGFNLMGIRFRHEVCEKWILEKTHVEEVLKNLRLADFSPEFCTTYEKQIISAFNNQKNSNLELSDVHSLEDVQQFLKQ